MKKHRIDDYEKIEITMGDNGLYNIALFPKKSEIVSIPEFIDRQEAINGLIDYLKRKLAEVTVGYKVTGSIVSPSILIESTYFILKNFEYFNYDFLYGLGKRASDYLKNKSKDDIKKITPKNIQIKTEHDTFKKTNQTKRLTSKPKKILTNNNGENTRFSLRKTMIPLVAILVMAGLGNILAKEAEERLFVTKDVAVASPVDDVISDNNITIDDIHFCDTEDINFNDGTVFEHSLNEIRKPNLLFPAFATRSVEKSQAFGDYLKDVIEIGVLLEEKTGYIITRESVLLEMSINFNETGYLKSNNFEETNNFDGSYNGLGAISYVNLGGEMKLAVYPDKETGLTASLYNKTSINEKAVYATIDYLDKGMDVFSLNNKMYSILEAGRISEYKSYLKFDVNKAKERVFSKHPEFIDVEKAYDYAFNHYKVTYPNYSDSYIHLLINAYIYSPNFLYEVGNLRVIGGLEYGNVSNISHSIIGWADNAEWIYQQAIGNEEILSFVDSYIDYYKTIKISDVFSEEKKTFLNK